MKWFKHMVDASDGNSLTAVFEELRHEGVCCYWLLLELAASKYSKEYSKKHGEKFTFHEKILRKKLRINSKKVELFLENFQKTFLLLYKKVGESYEIEIPRMRSILDEHTDRKSRNSRVTPDKLPVKLELELELEPELKLELELKPHSEKKVRAKKSVIISPEVFELVKLYGPIKAHKVESNSVGKIQEALDSCRQNYPLEKIHDGIRNYISIKGSWYANRYDLWHFLKKGMVRFYDDFKIEVYFPKKLNRGQQTFQANMALVQNRFSPQGDFNGDQ